MQRVKAQIREIVALPVGQHAALPTAWITCPKRIHPTPGRYLLGSLEEDTADPLATVLFPVGYSQDSFLAAPPIPSTWQPGAEINLHGPFGHGFTPPSTARRLALAAPSAPRGLLALLPGALASGKDIALFCDDPPGGLPASVEVSPLSGLTEGLRWADFLAVEVSRSEVERLSGWFNTEPRCPAQVLVTGPMPCGSLAGCGICAVNGRRGPLLACGDGPVFSLAKLRR